MSEKVKILFLAANPKASTRLRLDEEIRQIHEKIRAAEFRDSFELHSRWAVRFAAILQQMPKLIAEMKTDLSTEEGKHVREFFVLQRGNVLGGSEKPRFVYYENDHVNLRGLIDILENQGYLTDVTPKNVPIYRMSEEFVRLVLESPS